VSLCSSTWDWCHVTGTSSQVPWNGRGGRRLVELTEGCYFASIINVTPVSLGYPLSVFNKNSQRPTHSHKQNQNTHRLAVCSFVICSQGSWGQVLEKRIDARASRSQSSWRALRGRTPFAYGVSPTQGDTIPIGRYLLWKLGRWLISQRMQASPQTLKTVTVFSHELVHHRISKIWSAMPVILISQISFGTWQSVHSSSRDTVFPQFFCPTVFPDILFMSVPI